MKISDITLGERHRRDLGDLSSLKESIREIGLLHPVVVRPDGRLIAGERRLAACKALGWTDIPATEVALDDVLRGELAENTERKDFLPSEIEAIRRAMLPKETQAAAARETLGKVSPGSDTGRVRDKIGAYAGVSGRQVEKIATVVKAAEEEPKRFGRLVGEMDRTGKVDRAYREVRDARRDPDFQAEAESANRDLEIERDERIASAGAGEIWDRLQVAEKTVAMLDRRVAALTSEKGRLEYLVKHHSAKAKEWEERARALGWKE